MMSAQCYLCVAKLVGMDNSRLSKMISFSELASGTRGTGPVWRNKDCLKASLGACGVPILGWELVAAIATRGAWPRTRASER